MNEPEPFPDNLERELRRVAPLAQYSPGPDSGDSYPAPAIPSDESAASSSSHPLKLIDATASGTAKVRVVLGYTAGRIAHAGMNEPSDDPNFTVMLSAIGVRYVYADITVAYGVGTGKWTSSASTISEGSSVPAPAATHLYFEIGRATVESDGTGGTRIAAGTINQAVSGSQWVARDGIAHPFYAEAHGVQ